MAKDKHSKQLAAFIQMLKADWQGTYRKFPDLTILALQDERVVAAIEKRFAEQASLTGVRQLDYDFYTGLQNLVFDFSPNAAIPGGASACLVILEAKGKVIALIDPFDPVQPNKFVPPLPQESEQPFVLDRPSVSEHVHFSDEALYPLQVRNRAFMERIRGGGSSIIIDITATKCSYATRTPFGYWNDYQNDDCIEPPIIWV